jgi:hypothetical protein
VLISGRRKLERNLSDAILRQRAEQSIDETSHPAFREGAKTIAGSTISRPTRQARSVLV